LYFRLSLARAAKPGTQKISIFLGASRFNHKVENRGYAHLLRHNFEVLKSSWFSSKELENHIVGADGGVTRNVAEVPRSKMTRRSCDEKPLPLTTLQHACFRIKTANHIGPVYLSPLLNAALADEYLDWKPWSLHKDSYSGSKPCINHRMPHHRKNKETTKKDE
jgi:hypothetical protein